MDFILASSNSHKLEEFQKIFAGSVINLVLPEQSLEVVEDGSSFQENSLLKARAYYEKFGTPAMADDSGLNLVDFPDELGVHSARFAPEFPDYADKCEQVLKLYRDKELLLRDAYFSCTLCFYLNPEQIFFFEGRVPGHIASEAAGSGGFGYDPIFIPSENPSGTLAQMPDWKLENSHRGRAAAQAMEFFNSRA